ARDIRRHDSCPAEGAVDEPARGGASEEFVVGGELAAPDPERIAVGRALLEPGGKQPRRAERVDVARVGDAADIIERVAAAIRDLIDREMRARAVPAVF